MPATLITAHNGADATPEDSMDFVRHALASEADAIEIDIRRLANGTLVFTHDLPENLNARSLRENNAGGSSAAEVRTFPSGLITIEEVFHALRDSRKLVNCDLKEPGLETAVADLAAQCGVADRLLYSGTVSASYCMNTGLTRHVKILLNIEEYIPDLYVRCRMDPAQILQAARDISTVCRQYGVGCVNANYLLAADGFIDILMKNGLDLSVWTVDGLLEAKRFLDRGIYNMTTRNLQQILQLAE